MKKNLSISMRLTLLLIMLLAVIYPLLVSLAGKFTPGNGNGKPVVVGGKTVGYELIGQEFTDDKYFHGRPSAVSYHADGSAGSNKGPSNPDYLQTVSDRIDSFLVHNPGIKKEQVPAELVTASGSGLDPHISPQSAFIQVKRIASKRNLSESVVKKLVDDRIEESAFGRPVINVLLLNVALDELK